MMDWEAKHKELCRENVDERKVKGDSKERTKSKVDNLEEENSYLKSQGFDFTEQVQACQRGEKEGKTKKRNKEGKVKREDMERKVKMEDKEAKKEDKEGKAKKEEIVALKDKI